MKQTKIHMTTQEKYEDYIKHLKDNTPEGFKTSICHKFEVSARIITVLRKLGYVIYDRNKTLIWSPLFSDSDVSEVTTEVRDKMKADRELKKANNLVNEFHTSQHLTQIGVTEDQAIEYLKTLGYKIQKPVTTYEEV